MKELRFRANNGTEIWRAAFAFDTQSSAIILVAADKQGVGNEEKFYKKLLRVANRRLEKHEAALKKAAKAMAMAKPTESKRQESEMGKNIDDVIASFSPERQAKIRAGAQAKIDEMIREAKTLADVRNAVGKTQASVASALGIGQNAVSQLEKRSDVYLSTLRRMLKALNLNLKMSVENEAGTRVDLPDLFAIDAPSKFASAPSPRKSAPRKRAPRFVEPVFAKGVAVAGKRVHAFAQAGKQVASRKRVAPGGTTRNMPVASGNRSVSAAKSTGGARKT